MSAFVPWTSSQFKSDLPSRVDERIEADALDAANRKQWDKEIDLRDGKACRACDRKSDPDVIGLTTRGHRAHIVYASAGGSWEPSNRITLCFKCHNDEHKNRLRMTGAKEPVDANAAVTFWRKSKAGEWFVSREEIAVRQVTRD
jgi:5-methylcytosine-specific restriction endonuclease McrA